MAKIARRVRLALLLVLAATGCGTWHHWDYEAGPFRVGGRTQAWETFPPASPGAEVTLLEDWPPEPFTKVGRITVVWTRSSELLALAGFAPLGGTPLAAAGLRDQARRLGGDAVVTAAGGLDAPLCAEPSPLGLPASDSRGCGRVTVTGVVIRYRDERSGRHGPDGSRSCARPRCGAMLTTSRPFAGPCCGGRS